MSKKKINLFEKLEEETKVELIENEQCVTKIEIIENEQRKPPSIYLFTFVSSCVILEFETRFIL